MKKSIIPLAETAECGTHDTFFPFIFSIQLLTG
jgi:hypothetical protein